MKKKDGQRRAPAIINRNSDSNIIANAFKETYVRQYVSVPNNIKEMDEMFANFNAACE